MNKKTQKLISGIIILLLFISINLPVFGLTLTGEEISAKVFLDGKELQFNPPPVKVNDTIFLPITQFAKYIDAKVSFRGNTIQLSNDNFTAYLPKIYVKPAGYVFNPYIISHVFKTSWDSEQNALILYSNYTGKQQSSNNKTETASQNSVQNNAAGTKNSSQTVSSNNTSNTSSSSTKTNTMPPVTVKGDKYQLKMWAETVPPSRQYRKTIILTDDKTGTQPAADESWVVTLTYVSPSLNKPLENTEVNSDGYFGVKLDNSIFENGKPEKLICLAETKGTPDFPYISIEPIMDVDLSNYKEGDIIKIPASYGSVNYTVTLAENYRERYMSNGDVDISYYVLSQYKIYPEKADRVKFILPTTYVDSDNPEIIKTAQEITEGITDEAEKVRAIHEFVISKLSYDIKYAGYKNRPASTALKNGKAVCEGYSILFAALCRAVGIPCQNVIGLAQPENVSHMWNKVFVNGEWYFVDATYDDAGFKYFLVKSCHGYSVDSVKDPLQ